MFEPPHTSAPPGTASPHGCSDCAAADLETVLGLAEEALPVGWLRIELPLDDRDPPPDARVEASPGLGRLTGRANASALSLLDLLQPIQAEDRRRIRVDVSEALARGARFQVDYLAQGPAGRVRSCTAWGQPVIRGERRWLLVLVCDRTTEAAVHSAQACAAAVLGASHDGVMIVNADGLIADVNPRMCALTGYPRDQLVGANPRILQSGRHAPAFYAGLWTVLLRDGAWRGEIWNRTAAGQLVLLQAHLSIVPGPDGAPERFVACYADQTHLQHTRAALDRITHFDALTGLPNRALFRDRLSQRLASRAPSERLAVVHINLARFRRINEGLGHLAGDALLAAVSERLQRHLSPTCSLARLSADEFAIISTAEPSPELLCQRILAWLRTPFSIEGRSLHLDAAIGFATAPDDGDDPDALLRAADLALHRARARESAICSANPEAAVAAAEQLRVEQALRRAIALETLTPALQPQWTLSGPTPRLAGAEALARWHDPHLGEISPARFIPIAEQAGLIVDLDLCILREAARQWTTWLRAGHHPGRLAINLSPRHLALPRLVDRIRLILAETGLPPEHLEVEITEGILDRPLGEVRALLDPLRALGVTVALDDFGIAHSNLMRLLELPFDRLKFDRCLVTGIDASPRQATLLGGLIDLARRLDLETLVEGIETPEELRAVRRLSADCAQGFYLGRPTDLRGFERQHLDVAQAPGD